MFYQNSYNKQQYKYKLDSLFKHFRPILIDVALEWNYDMKYTKY